jgi:hypothetical protein
MIYLEAWQTGNGPQPQSKCVCPPIAEHYADYEDLVMFMADAAISYRERKITLNINKDKRSKASGIN